MVFHRNNPRLPYPSVLPSSARYLEAPDDDGEGERLRRWLTGASGMAAQQVHLGSWMGEGRGASSPIRCAGILAPACAQEEDGPIPLGQGALDHFIDLTSDDDLDI